MNSGHAYLLPDDGSKMSTSMPRSLFLNVTNRILAISMNATSGQNPPHKQLKPILATLIILLDVVIIVGNLSVILAMMFNPKLRTPRYYMITSLAVADLLLGLFVIPFAGANLLLDRWLFGTTFCRIYQTGDIMCSTVSILTLCAIAWDQFVAMRFPFSYKATASGPYIAAVIIMIWTVSGCIAIVPVNFELEWYREPTLLANYLDPSFCFIQIRKEFSLVVIPLTFYLPMISMISIYAYVLVSFKKRLNRIHDRTTSSARHKHDSSSKIESLNTSDLHGIGLADDSRMSNQLTGASRNRILENIVARQLKRSLNPPKISSLNLTQTLTVPNNQILHAKTDPGSISQLRPCTTSGGRSSYGISPGPNPNPTGGENRLSGVTVNMAAALKLKKQARVLKTVCLVTMAFVVCWTPFCILFVWQSVCWCLPASALNTMMWMGYLNSALNPLIYAAWNKDFKAAYKTMLCKRCCTTMCLRCCPNANPTTTNTSRTHQVNHAFLCSYLLNKLRKTARGDPTKMVTIGGHRSGSRMLSTTSDPTVGHGTN